MSLPLLQDGLRSVLVRRSSGLPSQREDGVSACDVVFQILTEGTKCKMSVYE
jgi:hypothetical protein